MSGWGFRRQNFTMHTYEYESIIIGKILRSKLKWPLPDIKSNMQAKDQLEGSRNCRRPATIAKS